MRAFPKAMCFSAGLSLFSKGRLFHWSAFLVVVACLCPTAHGQFKFREPPNRQDPDVLDVREGGFIWQQFLLNRALGIFRLEGVLVYRPPLRASESYSFLLEGDWSASAEHTSIRLGKENTPPLQWEVLVNRGNVFIGTGEDAPAEAEPSGRDALEAPIADGLPLTWDDLLMPYLQWNTVEYLGPDRYLGRPAHRYSLLNPLDEAFPAKVVVTIDEDYAALLEAELFSSDGALIKRLRVGGFRKFGDEWMFSTLNWELRPSRESIRLEVHSFSAKQD